MKSLVYNGPKTLNVEQRKIPEIKENEVLVKIKSSGICGSDLHGFLGTTGRRIAPMVMGHECSGIIEGVGSKVTKAKFGDKVVVFPLIACGECELCKSGYENVCNNRKFLGVMDLDGAFSEYLAISEDLVCIAKDQLAFEEGAIVEPTAVALRAVKNAGEIKGKNVLIVGAGTIGLLILQIVKLYKPKNVIVSDLSDTRLKTASKLGADYTLNPLKDDLDSEVLKITQTGVDIGIEAVGVGASVNQAMGVIKNHGKCIWVGNSAKEITINMQNIVTREVSVIGTYIYSRTDFNEAIELMYQKKIDVDTIVSHVISIEEGETIFGKILDNPDEYIKVLINM